MNDRANGCRRRERATTTTGNILHFLHHPSFRVYAYLHGRKNVISLKRLHVMNSLLLFLLLIFVFAALQLHRRMHFPLYSRFCYCFLPSETLLCSRVTSTAVLLCHVGINSTGTLSPIYSTHTDTRTHKISSPPLITAI